MKTLKAVVETVNRWIEKGEDVEVCPILRSIKADGFDLRIKRRKDNGVIQYVIIKVPPNSEADIGTI